MRLVRFAVPAVAAVALTAQQMERFEVVSIKPHPEPIAFTRDSVDGLSYHAVGLTLRGLIADAYGVVPHQISGGPESIASAHFDVDAKAGGSVPLTWERTRPMLQAMLADRFQLMVRREARKVPCYDLAPARGGPRMKENTDPGPAAGVAASADANGGHVRSDGGTMAQLARNLFGAAGRPVVDKTGLTGKYHIALDYASDSSPEAANGSVPTLFTALQEQLGLRLQPSTTEETVIVIESVQKPSAN